ncbi:MAG: NAD-dependent epimerase/dehydratase family protein [Opitutales bacterium]
MTHPAAGQPRFLITGGGGFIGRALIRRIRATCPGAAIGIFGRSPQPDLEASGVTVHRGDLADPAAVSRAVAGADGVFHVAARAGVWGPRAAYFSANLDGTRHVLAACRQHGVSRLVVTSTPSVVFTGEAFRGADESLPYGRNWLGPYAESKAAAEAEALAADQPGGLRVTALRPHLVYGPGDPHILPRIVARARAGRLRRVGEGANRVDISYVDNVAEAHWCAWQALAGGRGGGRPFFVSDGEPVVLWTWINRLFEAVGVNPVDKAVSLRAAYRIGAVLEGVWRLGLPGEPPMTRFVAVELARDHWFDGTAARDVLGYRPPVAPATALARSAAWLRGE